MPAVPVVPFISKTATHALTNDTLRISLSAETVEIPSMLRHMDSQTKKVFNTLLSV